MISKKIYAMVVAVMVISPLPCAADDAPLAADSEYGADMKSEYLSRDFSPLLIPNPQNEKFLGYIGTNYQRLYMVFTSVEKDEKNPAVYKVKGYSKVKNNRCDFEGTLTVNRISEQKELSDEHTNVAKKAGRLWASYTFNEKSSQPYTGQFEGNMTLDWYIDNADHLLYDNLFGGDGASNNQYAGTWAQYGKKEKSKVANWGEDRIPFSGDETHDLDNGAAEFSPNPKYKDRGWADMMPTN